MFGIQSKITSHAKKQGNIFKMKGEKILLNLNLNDKDNRIYQLKIFLKVIRTVFHMFKSEFSKVAGYKINFQYTSNERSEI